MTRFTAGLLALLFLLAGTAAGVVESTHHGLKVETIAATRTTVGYCAVNDSFLGWNNSSNKLQRLKPDLSGWTTLKDFADGNSWTGCGDIFSNVRGDIFLGVTGPDSLVRGERQADSSYVWSYVLGWPCTGGTSTRFWHMAEDSDSNLYAGQYGLGVADTCAKVFKSDDHGATWSNVYAGGGSGIHIHGVWCDENDSLYIAIGDTDANRRMMKSSDAGTNWRTIFDNDDIGELAQPIDCVTDADTRWFGTDVSTGQDSTNRVFRTDDDATIATALELSTGRGAYVWAMSKDDEGVIYAGTKANEAGDTIAIYYRMAWDDTTWYIAREYGTGSADFKGITFLTDFNTSGQALVYDSEGGTLHRISRKRNFTVGTGGDYADIAAAITGEADTGDTLILLAGTHSAGMNQHLPHNTTIRGATSDQSLYTIKNGGTSGDVFDIDSTAVFKNLTVRVIGTAITETFFEGDAVTADLTFDNVDFMSVESSGKAVIYTSNDDGHKVKFEDCRMESCDTSDELVLATNTEQFILRNCVVADNVSAEDGQFIVTLSATHDTVLVSYSLFADNTSQDDGCLRLAGNTDADRQKIDHCTFDNNTCTAEADGQLCLTSTAANVDVTHCIFTNGSSTYAISKVTDAGAENITDCNAWNNSLDNFLHAGDAGCVFSDTLHLDPIYNMTGTYLTGWYQAKASLVRDATNDGADYMGWELWTPGGQQPVGGKGGRHDDRVGHHR